MKNDAIKKTSNHLVMLLALICLSGNMALAATQTDIVGPAGSGQFGTHVAVLANGNIVVTDPSYDAPGPVADVGAVYLYNGATGALISMMTGSTASDGVGSGGVAVLSNGNYVVASGNWQNGAAIGAGAITFCNGATGCTGTVSIANSLVGSTTEDSVGQYGLVLLANGNFLMKSKDWDNGAAVDAGAVTFCSGTSGCSGAVSPSNSLVGTTMDDRVGNGFISELSNGNYLVKSIEWDNGAATQAGAVTFCNGATGCAGVISAANSLVGSTTDDFVGTPILLSNGNYVLQSAGWNNGAATDVGAVTWCSGTAGCTGTISPSNSLVGTTTNDLVGNVTALSNGNYVVNSFRWDNLAITDAGAVTWCSGTAGCTGEVSLANSLVGSSANDGLGIDIRELTNGNFLMTNSRWDNGPAADAGAVMWCSGTSPCTGIISAANSLVGTSMNDFVGDLSSHGRVTALSNGNYVVGAREWDNGVIVDAGAATFCNGTSGCTGVISAANSLVGSTADNKVGQLVTALSNGNYVVSSPRWDNGAVDVGATTFCSGTSGCTGAVSPGNSLIGSTAGDMVGSAQPLINGNYVVISPNWNNGAANFAGAATFCNGTSGCTGVVSPANSLVGSTLGDSVGGSGVVALDNGNYLVRSGVWDNGAATEAGAVTWCNGTSGCTGAVSSANSLVGSTTDDHIGHLFNNSQVIELSNGNYLVGNSEWDNGGMVDAGMAAWCSGTSGCTGAVSAANALVGTAANEQVGNGDVMALANGNYFVYTPGRAVTYGAGNAGTTIGPTTANNSVITTTTVFTPPVALDSVNEQLVVQRSNENIVSLFKPTYTAIVDGNWNDGATWDYGAFTKPQDASIPNGRVVDLDVIATVNSLLVGCTGELDWNLATSFIVGNMTKEFCSTGSMEFPVGTTANGNQLSLVEIRVQVLNTNPSSLTVRANYGTIAPLNDATTLDRYWTLTERGDLTGDLTFRYQDADVDGNENNYRLIRVSGGTAFSFPNDCIGGDTCVNPPSNAAGISNVSTFSNWTLGEPAAPTSAPASISGRITKSDGSPLSGVAMQLSGGVSRTATSDSSGNYRFDNLDVGNFYTVTPSLGNYHFSPANRSFSLLANVTDAVFTANPDGGGGTNAIDVTEYFVRQHYRDFLNREPDSDGLNFWTSVIDSCGADAPCKEIKRINVSAAFFLSIEFQETGYLAYRTRKAAFGNLSSAPVPLEFVDFLEDSQAIRRDVVVGVGNWQPQLEHNKNDYLLRFVQRADFLAANNYPLGMSASDFVNQLDSRAGKVLTASERNNLISMLGPMQANADNLVNRALVLRAVAEDAELKQAELNKAFVLMQYFGYLRRNPNSHPDSSFAGYDFWLNKLDQFNGDFVRADMVKAFISSGEYRHRFGP